MLNSVHLNKWNVFSFALLNLLLCIHCLLCVYLTIFVTVFKFNVIGDENYYETGESKREKHVYEMCFSSLPVNFFEHSTQFILISHIRRTQIE